MGNLVGFWEESEGGEVLAWIIPRIRHPWMRPRPGWTGLAGIWFALERDESLRSKPAAFHGGICGWEFPAWGACPGGREDLIRTR